MELDLEKSTNNDEEDNHGSVTYASDDKENYDRHMGVDANRSLEDNEIGMCEDFDWRMWYVYLKMHLEINLVSSKVSFDTI